MAESLDRIAFAWNRIVSKDRDLWFFGAMVLSACVAFLPFARETSISNFFVYALLPIILVFANPKKFKEISGPDWLGLLVASVLILGSFLFNWVTGHLSDDMTYGLTDYVILAAGVFAVFYSIRERLVRFGIVMLTIVRGATLALSMASATVFASVSDLFVGLVVFFSKVFVSPAIHSGSIAGEIVVGGAASGASVYIGWACAGLEELVLISVIIYILIASFGLDGRKTFLWLSVGIAGSLVVNIVRMVTLVGVAFHYGMNDMLWIHTHLGDLLFLVWIGMFWLLFFKLGAPAEKAPKTKA